jgi:hypothetical protein
LINEGNNQGRNRKVLQPGAPKCGFHVSETWPTFTALREESGLEPGEAYQSFMKCMALDELETLKHCSHPNMVPEEEPKNR